MIDIIVDWLNQTLWILLLFSHSVVSNSLWTHGLQHARLPCPSLTSRSLFKPWPLSWWCHPTISSSVAPFFSYSQSFSASESFPMSQLFASDGQSLGASASVLPMNSLDWFPLGLTGLISLQSKGLFQESSPTPQFEKHLFFGTHASLWSSSHIHTFLLEKPLVHFSSVAQSCPTLCSPMDCSIPGLPVHHQLLEFTQTHVRWVGDAIQPSHPLLSPSLAFSLSQHQGLFKWVSSLHHVAKVLEFQLQHQSFQWTFRTDFL